MPYKKYKIRLLKIAEEDFTEIVIFIASEDPIKAITIADKTEKT